MNTNNKEAIELSFETQQEIDRLARKAYTPSSNSNKYRYNLYAFIEELLNSQDNEDTEVKEEPLLQNNPGHEHLPSGVGEGAYCVGCLEILDKPSSKVEKLNRLMVDVEQGENLREAMIRLIELIEDEE